MSDPRAPSIKYKMELPGKTGRFRPALTIELYPAWQWSDKFGPTSPKRKDCWFDGLGLPKVDSESKGYYRILINGKWWSRKAGIQYQFFRKNYGPRLLEELKS